MVAFPALGRLREEVGEFKTSLDDSARHHLKTKILISLSKTVFQGRQKQHGGQQERGPEQGCLHGHRLSS